MKDYKNTFKNKQAWGLSATIDLKNCDPKLVTDKEAIRFFVEKLVESIDMELYGDMVIERFGEGKLKGYSVMQLIKTSSITMHFGDNEPYAFIDIFSCKPYDPEAAAIFCKKWLGAESMTFDYKFRL